MRDRWEKLKIKSRFIPSRVVCPCCTLERPATVILYFFSFVLVFVFPALSGITRVSFVYTLPVRPTVLSCYGYI